MPSMFRMMPSLGGILDEERRFAETPEMSIPSEFSRPAVMPQGEGFGGSKGGMLSPQVMPPGFSGDLERKALPTSSPFKMNQSSPMNQPQIPQPQSPQSAPSRSMFLNPALSQESFSPRRSMGNISQSIPPNRPQKRPITRPSLGGIRNPNRFGAGSPY